MTLLNDVKDELSLIDDEPDLVKKAQAAAMIRNKMYKTSAILPENQIYLLLDLPIIYGKIRINQVAAVNNRNGITKTCLITLCL